METARTRFVQERQSILHVLHVVRALIWIATNERNDKLLEDIETREQIYRVIRNYTSNKSTFRDQFRYLENSRIVARTDLEDSFSIF